MHKKYIIIIAIVFAILFLLSLFSNAYDNIQVGEQYKELKRRYLLNTDFCIKGHLVNKTFLYEYGSDYKKVYLITIHVTDITIKKNIKSTKSLYWGVYYPSSRTLYFVSDFWGANNIDNINVNVSSKKLSIEFSNGCQTFMRITDSEFEILEKLSKDKHVVKL